MSPAFSTLEWAWSMSMELIAIIKILIIIFVITILISNTFFNMLTILINMPMINIIFIFDDHCAHDHLYLLPGQGSRSIRWSIAIIIIKPMIIFIYDLVRAVTPVDHRWSIARIIIKPMIIFIYHLIRAVAHQTRVDLGVFHIRKHCLC